jgi:two-component system, OmpR family, alkaline phosphatase synthesis response regulator PhoP
MERNGERPSDAGRLVLVISADGEMNDAVIDALESAGYETALAKLGEVGVEMARRLRPDVLLVNFMLPDMSGMDLCHRLTEADETRSVPIVVVSDRNDAAEKVLAFESGAKRFISKPFSKVELEKEVGTALEQLERTKQIVNYRESCGGKGDLGVFPSDLKEQTEKCEKDKKDEG